MNLLLNFSMIILGLVIFPLWFSFCALLALLGILIPCATESLTADFVKSQTTVCKILHHKGQLTAEEYRFETDVVAPSYDHSTFAGYRFIWAPMMFFLKRVNTFDPMMVFLVQLWMKSQHVIHRNGGGWMPPVANFCVAIARSTGHSLFLIWNFSQMKMKI